MGTMMIRMPRQKLDDMSEHIEKGLRYIGKAMQCIDEMQNEDMGERGWEVREMPGHYGERMDKYPDDTNWRYPVMGERKMRDYRGRYM